MNCFSIIVEGDWQYKKYFLVFGLQYLMNIIETSHMKLFRICGLCKLASDVTVATGHNICNVSAAESQYDR